MDKAYVLRLHGIDPTGGLTWPTQTRRQGRVIRSPTPEDGINSMDVDSSSSTSPVPADDGNDVVIDWTPTIVDDGISYGQFFDNTTAQELAEEAARADQFFEEIINQDMLIDSSPASDSPRLQAAATIVDTTQESLGEVDEDLNSSIGQINPDEWLAQARHALHLRVYFRVKAWGIRDLFANGSRPISLPADFRDQGRALIQQGVEYDNTVRALWQLIRGRIPDSQTLEWYNLEVENGVTTLDHLRYQFFPHIRTLVQAAEGADRALAEDRGAEESMLANVESAFQNTLRQWSQVIDRMLEDIARELTNIQSKPIPSIETGSYNAVPPRDAIFSPRQPSAPTGSIERRLSSSSVLTELTDAQIEALRPSPPRQRRRLCATGATSELKRLNINDNVFSTRVPDISATSTGLRQTRAHYRAVSQGRKK